MQQLAPMFNPKMAKEERLWKKRMATHVVIPALSLVTFQALRQGLKYTKTMMLKPVRVCFWVEYLTYLCSAESWILNFYVKYE